MIGRLAAGVRRTIQSAARRDIGFVSHNGIQTGPAAGLVELDRAVKIAMVGNRQGRHAQLFGPRHQLIDRARAVEQAVVSMAMQMGKRRRSHEKFLPWRRASESSPQRSQRIWKRYGNTNMS